MSLTDPLVALAPWDAVRYFQTVTEGHVTFTVAATKQVVAADPMRVALLIDCIASAGVVSLTLANPGVVGVGVQVGTTKPQLLLRWEEVGPLVQQTWFAVASGAATVTFYSISLSQWPDLSPGRKRRRNG